MNIRPYDESDLAAVAALFTLSIHRLAVGYYDAQQRAAWAPQPPDLQEWRRRMSGLKTLVAETDGELGGFIAYEMNGHIDLLYTSPTHPRQGVATSLYRQVETEMRVAGVEVLTTEASLVARPFFDRQGFDVVEEQNVSRRGIWFRRYAMRKSLASQHS